MMLLSYLERVRGHTIWTRPLGPQSVIIDAGAHKGEFGATMHERFSCQCYAVEAHPELGGALKSPYRGVVGAALAGSNGRARFNFQENPEAGSVANAGSEDSDRGTEVELVSLPSLIARFGVTTVDLLKLDIEGSEFDLISRTPDSLLASIGQITVEFHDFLPAFKDGELYDKARTRLERMGFFAIPVSIRTHGDVLFVNKRLVDSSVARWLLKAAAPWKMKLMRPS